MSTPIPSENTPPPPKPFRWNHWSTFFVLALFLLVVWRVFGRHTFDFKAFFEALASMDPYWLGAAVGIIFVSYIGRALRWMVMLRPVAPQARFMPLLEATMIGFCGGVLLGRAGEFLRPYLIAKQENVSFASQIAIWFLERLTDLLAVLVILGWALSSIHPAVASRVGPEIGWVLQFGGWASLAIGVVSLLILLAFRQFPDLAARRVTDGAEFLPEPVRAKLGRLLEAFSAGMHVTRNGRGMALILVYSFAEWLLIELCYYCIFRSFAPTADLTIRDTLIVLGLVSFGSVVQFPGVGGGMQIVAILVLQQMFGVSIEDATAVATVLWGIGLAIVVPPGLILAARRGVSWTKLNLAEERPV